MFEKKELIPMLQELLTNGETCDEDAGLSIVREVPLRPPHL
jgi:hypothetical protein